LKDPNFDLELTNDQTKEVYNETAMIPQAASVIVKRVPVKAQRRKVETGMPGRGSLGGIKKKHWNKNERF
jgi:hypothetical protein